MKFSLDGLLLIDKPAGVTSHDVVDIIRRRFRIRQVGHGGTLDPAATGLLILLVGQATRRASVLLGADKSYLATLHLGIITETQDGMGRVLETREVGSLTLLQIERACVHFRGEIEQEVPAYSAVRIRGRRSYEWARAGIAIPRQKRRVTIHELKVTGVRLPDVELDVTCSKGTYIRTLCADLGTQLGCGGHMSQLRRVRAGPFSVDQAVKPEEAGPQHLLPC